MSNSSSQVNPFTFTGYVWNGEVLTETFRHFVEDFLGQTSNL